MAAHGRFVWYELTTTDIQSGQAFYSAVVGWGTRDASMPGMPYTVFTAGEASVCGMMELPKEAREMGERPMWIGYVCVDDVDAVADRVKQLGPTAMRDDVRDQAAVEAAGQHHLDAGRSQSADRVLGARDRYTAAAR